MKSCLQVSIVSHFYSIHIEFLQQNTMGIHEHTQIFPVLSLIYWNKNNMQYCNALQMFIKNQISYGILYMVYFGYVKKSTLHLQYADGTYFPNISETIQTGLSYTTATTDISLTLTEYMYHNSLDMMSRLLICPSPFFWSHKLKIKGKI